MTADAMTPSALSEGTLSTDPEPDVATIWRLLQQRLFRGMHRHISAVVSDAGLSLSQAKLLWWLGTDEHQTQREAAHWLECDPSNVTTNADALETRGLIERRLDPQDRRLRTLALTPAGAALREELLGHVMQPPPWLTPLSTEEARVLYGLLSRLLSAADDGPCW